VLEEALAELYGVEPGEFTATRNALRDRLRDAGDAEAAKEIARARRPTTSAWALNRLAREHPDLIEDVIERTRDVAAAQERALPGQADEMREVMRERREALVAAADAAVTIVARITDNPGTYRDPILASLEAGSLDDASAATLRTGRHVKETTGPVGFPGTAPAPARPAALRAPKAKRRAKDGDAAAAARERELEDARSEAAEAEDAARTVAEEAEAAASTLAAAEERVEAAEAEVEEGRSKLHAAKRAAREARSEAQRLERAAATAAKAADATRRRAEQA
jgi:hypothetical protein